MVVHGLVGTLDVESAPRDGAPHAARLELGDQGFLIGVDLDEHGLGLAGQIAHLARLHQRSGLKHDDPIARAFDIGHQVGRKQDADAEFPMRLANEVEHLFAACRVETRRRFIQEDHSGIVDERLRELYALLHAGRVAADRAIALLEQAHVPQRVRRAGPCARRRQPAQLRHVREELSGAHARRETIVLRHVPELCAHGDALGRILAQDHRRAGGRLEQTQEDLDGRALPGSVLTENPGDSVEDAEADAAEGHDIPVVLHQIGGGDQGPHGWTWLSQRLGGLRCHGGSHDLPHASS